MNVVGLEREFADYIMTRAKSMVGHRKVDMLVNHSNHFIICCNVCEENVLSSSPVQILKYFPCYKKDRSSFDIDFSNNDFVKLNCKSFDKIQIKIADLTGRTVKPLSHHSTRLQILFVNTNSV